MSDAKPTRYDLQVAAQIALLKKLGLWVHIPKRGEVYFTRKPTPSNETRHRGV